MHLSPKPCLTRHVVPTADLPGAPGLLTSSGTSAAAHWLEFPSVCPHLGMSWSPLGASLYHPNHILPILLCAGPTPPLSLVSNHLHPAPTPATETLGCFIYNSSPSSNYPSKAAITIPFAKEETETVNTHDFLKVTQLI